MRHARSRLGMLTCLAATAIACSDEPAAPGAQASEVRSSHARAASTAPAADVASVVRGNTTFALDLHRAVSAAAGNVVASPYSASTALAMTWAGARSGSLTRMRAALRLPDVEPARVHAAFNAIDLRLASQTAQPVSMENPRPARLQTANALWAQQGRSFQPAFLDVLAESYDAPVHLTDFAGSPDPSRLAINRWVSDRTAAKIPSLLGPGTITPLTVFVLTNAVHFTAGWRRSFDPAATAPADFHVSDTMTVSAPTMHQVARLSYAEGTGWKAVSLGYQGTDLRMLVIVPDAGTFAAFERDLTAEGLEAIAGAVSDHIVTLSLPRFAFRSQNSLAAPLSAMGMREEFTPGAPDFSGIDGTQTIYLKDVVHEGYIAVDENGTEAAAATAVIGEAVNLPPPATLNVDRPFLFAIQSPTTGVLFFGRVTNPTAS